MVNTMSIRNNSFCALVVLNNLQCISIGAITHRNIVGHPQQLIVLVENLEQQANYKNEQDRNTSNCYSFPTKFYNKE